jgi:GTPase SAR1 family protein
MSGVPSSYLSLDPAAPNFGSPAHPLSHHHIPSPDPARDVYSSASSSSSSPVPPLSSHSLASTDEKEEISKFLLPPHADAIHTHTHMMSSAAARILNLHSSSSLSSAIPLHSSSPSSAHSSSLPNVSRPANVHRVIHVEWDEKRKAFTGVPDVWKDIMPQSADYIPSDLLPDYISPRPRINEEKSKSNTSSLSSSSASSCLPRSNLSTSQFSDSLIGSEKAKKQQKLKSKALASNSHIQAAKQPTVSSPQITVREYMKALGFLELDQKFSPAVLREMLLSKLSFGPSGGLFLRVPYVLKLKILSHLDYQSLLRVCCLCTEMLQYSENRSLWKPLVYLKNRQQRTLYSSDLDKTHDWKRSFMTMTLLDRNMSYFDLLWNVVIIGDKSVGKSRLVHTLGQSARVGKGNSNVSTPVPTIPIRSSFRHSKSNSLSLLAQAQLLQEDPVLDPVSGIFRLGIDFVTRRVVLNSTVIKLQVWDGTAFANIFNKAHVVAIVFDTSRQSSFDQIPLILADTRRSLHFLNLTEVMILLFGNITSQSSEQRQVHYDTAKRFANSVGMIYIEANASDEESVDQAFAQLAMECWNIANNGNGIGLSGLASGREEITQSKCSIM